MQDVFDRSDELSIPDAGYTLPRRSGVVSNRRLAVIAAVIGVGLLGIGGGLELASRRSTGVPVITADSRPIRVRPDNPGGMQVIGSNEGGDTDTGKESMAPPPEVPDTKSLHAEQQADLAARAKPASAPPSSGAAASAPSASDQLPAPPTAAMLARTGTAAPDVPLPPVYALPDGNAPAAVALPPAHAHPGPVTAASSAATVPAAPPSAPPRTVEPAKIAMTSPMPAAVGGHHSVQLAAVGSEEAATSEWQRLSHRMPDLLGGRRPEIVKFDHDGHVFWRVRTGGFPDNADATAFCDRVRAKGASCAAF